MLPLSCLEIRGSFSEILILTFITPLILFARCFADSSFQLDYKRSKCSLSSSHQPDLTMKSLLILAVFAAFLALTWAHHGMRRRGGCNCDDDDDDDYMPECRRGNRHENDAGHGYGGYGRHESDTSHGYGGYGRHENDAGHGYGGYSKKKHDERVYKFQIGDNFGAYEYLDEQGYLRGFYVDLLTAVCKKAGKKCAYLLDSYDNCWKTTGEREYAGVGMLDGWYDGCLGMLPSPDRLNTFNFTSAFTPNVKAALHWREKDEMGDRKNLTGRKIGFIEGWAVSQRCLKRQYNITGHNNFVAVMFQTHEQLVSALLNKEVDAILTVDVFDSTKLGIVPQEPWFACTLRGLSVMTHYYSDVIGWWNCAFARLKRSGEFRELCEQAQEKHGHRGTIRCI